MMICLAAAIMMSSWMESDSILVTITSVSWMDANDPSGVVVNDDHHDDDGGVRTIGAAGQSTRLPNRMDHGP